MDADLNPEWVIRQIMVQAKTLVGAGVASVFLVVTASKVPYSTLDSTNTYMMPMLLVYAFMMPCMLAWEVGEGDKFSIGVWIPVHSFEMELEALSHHCLSNCGMTGQWAIKGRHYTDKCEVPRGTSANGPAVFIVRSMLHGLVSIGGQVCSTHLIS